MKGENAEKEQGQEGINEETRKKGRNKAKKGRLKGWVERKEKKVPRKITKLRRHNYYIC